jgi:hypothetical protein
MRPSQISAQVPEQALIGHAVQRTGAQDQRSQGAPPVLDDGHRRWEAGLLEQPVDHVLLHALVGPQGADFCQPALRPRHVELLDQVRDVLDLFAVDDDGNLRSDTVVQSARIPLGNVASCISQPDQVHSCCPQVRVCEGAQILCMHLVPVEQLLIRQDWIVIPAP